LFRVPERRSYKRFGTLRIGLVDRDLDSQAWCFSLDRRRCKQVGIINEYSSAVHSERVGHPGDNEEQPDVRVGDDVAQRVGDAIPGALGDQEGLIIEDAHETGRVTPRAEIAVAVRIRGRKTHERRPFDERSCRVVEPVADLGDSRRRRFTEESPKLFFSRDLHDSTVRRRGPVGSPNMKITNGSVELNVEVAGDEQAPPVLFLHGIINASVTWDWLVDTVAATHRVVRLDFRGHGASARAEGSYRFAGYVSDAVAVCEQVIGRPTVVVGHSLGGGTAAALAQTRPDLVSALCLEDPAFQSPDDPMPEKHTLREAFGLLRQTIPMFQSSGMTVESLAAALHGAPSSSGMTFGELLEPDGLRAMASGFLDVDATVLDPVIDNSMEPVFRSDVTIPVRTLVLAADMSSPDGIVSAETAARVTTASPLVEIRRIAGAGHLIHDASAHRANFLSALMEFLRAS
jgi:pimeloyl-ACP methyl ester carboxylesterase